MKKLTVILLAAAMLFSLSACGSSNTDDQSSDDQSSTKTLRVAMECGYAPYNWTQEDDANGAVPIADSSDYAYGYDVMIAKIIAEDLGYNLEIVKLDWDALVPAVESGSVDAVIAGQSSTAERKEKVDFSDPYFYATIVTLVKADSKYADATGISDLAGATCTSQLSTIWYNKCLPQIKDANILAAQESSSSMLVALESDAVDLVVTDKPTALAAVERYPDMKMLDFADSGDDFEVSEEDINIGVSVQKGNTELLNGINSVLAKYTEDDFVKMMEEAASVQPMTD